MGRRRIKYVWLGACACLLAAAAVPAFAQKAGDNAVNEPAPRPAADAGDLTSVYAPSNLNLETLSPEAQSASAPSSRSRRWPPTARWRSSLASRRRIAT